MGVKRADALFDQLGPTVLKDIRLDQLDLSGKKVGIDATLWLGTVKSMLKANQKKLSSSTEKFLVKVQEKTYFLYHFIAYCEDRFKLLNRIKIKSMMVFDGNATPRKTEIKMLWKKIKEGSSKKKEVNIDPNPDSDIDHECDSDSDGDNDRDNERKKVNYNKPEKMYIPDRKRVLEWLTKEGVEFIVAPYEADAQLTYLTIKGKIDAVITEDSDLIALVIYKLDVNTQMCKHYSFDRLKDHHLYGTFTKKMLLEMCIMIGCDYLPNLQGIGIQKAGDAIKESKTFANIIPYKKNIKLRIEADKFETNTPKILEEFKKAIKSFHLSTSL
ncbi:exonuclease 1-like [Rosa rugosa]|uniref:exonuclease 1-like n=1 Tax=Rosa rugosa TaxID=74645 RepID=UPI002B40B19F|nr:exonuclease 1-like [Rosa rugosa]